MPDVVTFPTTVAEVQQVVRAARGAQLAIVPYGGGSGIVGGALPIGGGVMVEMKGLAGLEAFDPISGLATVGAGTNGQRLEDTLNERGFTCGHYPQSLRSSTVGGWIAHRATGTASTRYGGIEELVAGLRVVLPSGDLLDLRPEPRVASGIDLKQLFLGGEGTMGIVTSATLRVWELPQERIWSVSSYPSFADGLECIRRIVRAGLRPAVVRLYDETETADRFGSAEHAGRSVLILNSEGDAEAARWNAGQIQRICEAAGGQPEAQAYAQAWWDTRFATVGLLATIGRPMAIADAVEVSAPWSRLYCVYLAMRDAMTAAMASTGEPLAVYGHTSHAYPDGANLYMIFHGRTRSTSELPVLYEATLAAALGACAAEGGSISHHHGIGYSKARWLSLEYGTAGLELLRAIQRGIDPARLMNPGKLGDAERT
jgi:alkyldihydroxyacetonephosphate synthase